MRVVRVVIVIRVVVLRSQNVGLSKIGQVLEVDHAVPNATKEAVDCDVLQDIQPQRFAKLARGAGFANDVLK